MKKPVLSPAEALNLRPGQSLELLKSLHILTRDGQINQDSRRKLKQVNHLVQFIEPIIDAIRQDTGGPFTLVDHGAGKSYLGFMLYDMVLKAKPEGACVVGVETRQALVDTSRELATKAGFAQGMRFLNMAVQDSAEHPELPDTIHMVTALHACNTATDDAIAFGLAKQARAMALVPCCQAELAERLRAGKSGQLGRSSLVELWRHPLHTREFGSQLTNVLRCLWLESQGYQVTVTELVGWEHSMKNELILARKHQRSNPKAAERLKALLLDLGLGEDEALLRRYGLAQA